MSSYVWQVNSRNTTSFRLWPTHNPGSGTDTCEDVKNSLASLYFSCVFLFFCSLPSRVSTLVLFFSLLLVFSSSLYFYRHPFFLSFSKYAAFSSSFILSFLSPFYCLLPSSSSHFLLYFSLPFFPSFPYLRSFPFLVPYSFHPPCLISLHFTFVPPLPSSSSSSYSLFCPFHTLSVLLPAFLLLCRHFSPLSVPLSVMHPSFR